MNEFTYSELALGVKNEQNNHKDCTRTLHSIIYPQERKKKKISEG